MFQRAHMHKHSKTAKAECGTRYRPLDEGYDPVCTWWDEPLSAGGARNSPTGSKIEHAACIMTYVEVPPNSRGKWLPVVLASLCWPMGACPSEANKCRVKDPDWLAFVSSTTDIMLMCAMRASTWYHPILSELNSRRDLLCNEKHEMKSINHCPLHMTAPCNCSLYTSEHKIYLVNPLKQTRWAQSKQSLL